jgi:hypothetical protein
MKTVRGVKMIDDTDIFLLSGNRTPMCQYLKDIYHYCKIDFLADIDNDNKIVVDRMEEKLRFLIY